MQQLQRFIEPLRLTVLDRIEALRPIEQKTKIKPSYMLLILLAVLLLLSPVIYTHGLLTSIVCYLAPAYLSFLALESIDKEDDIKYLNYWVIFALMEVSVPLLRLFLNKFFYMAFRVLFTLVLLHPMTNLSVVIYNNIVRPFMSKSSEAINDGINKISDAAQSRSKTAQGQA